MAVELNDLGQLPFAGLQVNNFRRNDEVRAESELVPGEDLTVKEQRLVGIVQGRKGNSLFIGMKDQAGGNAQTDAPLGGVWRGHHAHERAADGAGGDSWEIP